MNTVNNGDKVVDATDTRVRVETQPLSFDINKPVFVSADETLKIAFSYFRAKETGKQYFKINVDLEGQAPFEIQCYGMDNGKGIHARTDHKDYQFVFGEKGSFAGRKTVSAS